MLKIHQLIIGSLITIILTTFGGSTAGVPDQAEHPVALEKPTSTHQQEKPPLPVSVNIQMPFYSQAPLGNWTLPFAESCEEASALLIANYYYQHNWTAQNFNDQILGVVDWEKKHFNKYIDTSAGETSQILNQYLNLQTTIHENPSLDDLKNILASGHLIIGFFAGKELNNPNYRNGGPNYHAIVIKGYRDNDQIITDDVGTEKGADYIYSWSTLDHALHDLATPIDSGLKKIIEVWPPN